MSKRERDEAFLEAVAANLSHHDSSIDQRRSLSVPMGSRPPSQCHEPAGADCVGEDGELIALPQDPSPEVFERKRKNFLRTYLRRLKGAGETAPTIWAPTIDAVPSFVFTVIALMILNVIQAFGLQKYDKDIESFIPSMGSSCAAALCLFSTPGAQPRAFVGTQVVGAFLGVSWKHIFSNLPFLLGSQMATAFSVAMLTSGMMVLDALQPSSSATTCVASFKAYGLMADQGYMLLATPAFLGPAIIMVVGWLLNNAVPWRRNYPLWV